MAITDNILRVNNVRGVVTSLIDRGNQPRLINQNYSTTEDLNFTLEEERAYLKRYNKKTIKDIPLDVVIRYSPRMSTTVTGNPVQIGVNVNDHTYNDPDTMVINFGTSDVKGTLARMQGLVKAVQSVYDDWKSLETPSRALLSLLYKAKEQRTVFTIDDGLHTYTDMLIKEIEYDKDKTTYRSLVATVVLQQMIFVDVVAEDLKNGIIRTQAVALSNSTYAAKANTIARIILV